MQNIHKFEKDLKIKFKNKSLIIEALTHKSANQQINNEKLEFLGDRVLGLILSKIGEEKKIDVNEKEVQQSIQEQIMSQPDAKDQILSFYKTTYENPSKKYSQYSKYTRKIVR